MAYFGELVRAKSSYVEDTEVRKHMREMSDAD